jgi:hypothetical protein
MATARSRSPLGPAIRESDEGWDATMMSKLDSQSDLILG